MNLNLCFIGTPVLQKTIPNNSTFTTTLTELKKFVVYHIQVLAYTRLGDGTLSAPPVRVQTFEDSPGRPSNVSFPDVSGSKFFKYLKCLLKLNSLKQFIFSECTNNMGCS